MESRIVDQSSMIAPEGGVPAAQPTLDRLSALLERFRVRAQLFHNGSLCDRASFEARPGRAFLHVLRRGRLQVHHEPEPGLPRALDLGEPSLLLYARPVFHAFVHPPQEGSDFTCATLDFDGGEHNPIVRALPPLICLPLARIDGLRPTLDVLFAETDHIRCGSRILIDRLFEVVLIQTLRWVLDHPAEAGVGAGLFAGLADPRLARALVAMHCAPARAWSVAALAREAAMSRSAFAQAFKEATGVPPARYLADWRLTLAMGLLREGRALKQVAEEVGFAAASSLSRAFRKRYGACSRQWFARSASG